LHRLFWSINWDWIYNFQRINIQIAATPAYGSIDATGDSTEVRSAGVSVVTIRQIMNAARCTAIIGGAGIFVIAIHQIMNAARCTAIIGGAGIFVIAIHQIMNTASFSIIISGTRIFIITICRFIDIFRSVLS